MRRLLIALSAVAALTLLAACGGSGDGKAGTGAAATGEPATSSPQPAALATKTVEAGAVTVKIDPVRIDAGGAEFKVNFDTHSVALDLDVARSAALAVGGSQWAGAAWSGAGPGGHHREGTLRFDPGGPATGPAVLTITGLPAPVTATWSLGS